MSHSVMLRKKHYATFHGGRKKVLNCIQQRHESIQKVIWRSRLTYDLPAKMKDNAKMTNVWPWIITLGAPSSDYHKWITLIFANQKLVATESCRFAEHAKAVHWKVGSHTAQTTALQLFPRCFGSHGNRSSLLSKNGQQTWPSNSFDCLMCCKCQQLPPIRRFRDS